MSLSPNKATPMATRRRSNTARSPLGPGSRSPEAQKNQGPSSAPRENIKSFLRVRPFTDLELVLARRSKTTLAPHFGMSLGDTTISLIPKAAGALGDSMSNSLMGNALTGEGVEVDGLLWGVPVMQSPVPSGIKAPVANNADAHTRATVGIPESMLRGNNCCILAVGGTKSGKSRSIWGDVDILRALVNPESSPLKSDAVEREAVRGIALQVADGLFDRINSIGTSRKVDVTVSIFEVLHDKTRDLLAVTSDDDPQSAAKGDFRHRPVKYHPLLGPSIDGMTAVPVESAVDLEPVLLKALELHHASEAASTTALCMHVDVNQTETKGGDQNGSTSPKPEEDSKTSGGAHTVRLSRLAVYDAASWGRQLAASHTTAMRRVVEALYQNQQPNRRQVPVSYRDSYFTALLHGPLGGYWRTVVIGHASPHPDHADDTTAVSKFLAKVRGVGNLVRPSGKTTADAITDVEEEIARLRKATDSDDAVAKLKDKENALAVLQATTNRAIERFEEVQLQLEETQQLNQTLREEHARAEVAKNSAMVELSEEKQKAFAQAFRNAFQVGRQDMERKAQEAETQRHVRALKEQIEQSQQQLTATKGERDRNRFEAVRLDKEVKRLRVELNAARSHTSKVEKELHQSMDAREALETQLNLARFESTSETHTLRSEVLRLEQARDESQFEVDSKNKEIRKLRLELESLTQDVRREADAKIAESDSARREEKDRCAALKSKLDRSAEENAALEQTIKELRASVEDARRDYEAKSEVLDRHRLREQERLAKVKDAHAIEREGYLKLLDEGMSTLEDLREAEALVINRPTMHHRSGWQGVTAWLRANTLDFLQSPFEENGFTDMAAVVNITEADLATMKVLPGTRRKILAAAAAAKTSMADAKLKRTETKTSSGQQSPRPSTAGTPRGSMSFSRGPSSTPPANVRRESSTSGSPLLSATPSRTLAPSTSENIASASPSGTIRPLLEELYEWMNDFELAIEAESESAAQRDASIGNITPQRDRSL